MAALSPSPKNGSSLHGTCNLVRFVLSLARDTLNPVNNLKYQKIIIGLVTLITVVDMKISIVNFIETKERWN